LGRSVGRPLSLHNPQIRIFDPAIKSVALLLPQKLPSHAHGVFTKLEALGAEQILIRVIDAKGIALKRIASLKTAPGSFSVGGATIIRTTQGQPRHDLGTKLA
jgi:hypothetical protein